MKNIVILGATSAIAAEAARQFGARGDALFLVGRSPEKMSALEQDLKTRGAKNLKCVLADLDPEGGHAGLLEAARAHLGSVDVLLLAHGVLGDQSDFEAHPEKAIATIQTNLSSAVSLLLHAAQIFERQKSGTIVTITSVAGDRGRRSNYVYAASKGGLSIFLSGLRARLARVGCSVVDIRPGFVDTPMTAEFKKGLLWASPRKIAKGIVRAADRPRSVIYLPRFWSLIMWVIRSIPTPIFNRLNF